MAGRKGGKPWQEISRVDIWRESKRSSWRFIWISQPHLFAMLAAWFENLISSTSRSTFMMRSVWTFKWLRRHKINHIRFFSRRFNRSTVDRLTTISVSRSRFQSAAKLPHSWRAWFVVFKLFKRIVFCVRLNYALWISRTSSITQPGTEDYEG